MTTRALVTGASGQIGSELVPYLKARYGDGNVAPTVFPPEQLKGLPWHAQVLDVMDPAALTEAMQESRADTVYHLGGILSATGERDPELAWRVNLLGLKNVLDAAHSVGVPRIFWPSSIAVFGPDAPRSMAPQGTALHPTTIYGVTKVAGELLCNYYDIRYGVDVRCIRYPGVISSEALPGGGTTDYAVGMFYAALKGETFTCFVSRDTILPMMYMADALRAAVEVTEADPSRVPRHTGYNLAAVSFSAGELEEAIRAKVPGFKAVYLPDSRQKIADSWPTSIDDSEARRDWGWHHEYDLERMVDVMLTRLRARLQRQKDG